jgi:hypothetical protein
MKILLTFITYIIYISSLVTLKKKESIFILSLIILSFRVLNISKCFFFASLHAWLVNVEGQGIYLSFNETDVNEKNCF